MQIPRRVREGVQLLAEDALIVVGVSLCIVGVVELSGWSSKELLQGYTPLLLAMFSIIVTVSALRLNIKEGRERAERERNDAVRPFIVVRPYDSSTYLKNESCLFLNLVKEEGRIFDAGPNSSSNFFNHRLYLFNSGLGPALNINFVARFGNQLMTSANPINEIEVKNSRPVRLSYSKAFLECDSLYTVYMDIYGNYHALENFLQVDDGRLRFLTSFYMGTDSEDENIEVIEYVKRSPIFFY